LGLGPSTLGEIKEASVEISGFEDEEWTGMRLVVSTYSGERSIFVEVVLSTFLSTMPRAEGVNGDWMIAD